MPTLRFWASADVRTELSHRRRIQQPWSLLLQLISLLLLLTAIAGPQFGLLDGNGRDHVLVLDTSAWMGSQGSTGTRAAPVLLIDEARNAALAYLKTLPSRDRVMLVRADALATPATAFELNRGIVEQAIRQSRPGTSALNLAQALEFAQNAQKMQARRAGEIVFTGAGRVDGESSAVFATPTNLRVLPVSAPLENVGLRKIGLRRALAEPDTWEIFVAVKNYGVRPHDVDLGLQFAKSPAGAQHLSLKPGAEEQVNFKYQTKVGGFLEARLNIRDAFPDDDRALIELPAEASLARGRLFQRARVAPPLDRVQSASLRRFPTGRQLQPGGEGRRRSAGSLRATVPARHQCDLDAAPFKGISHSGRWARTRT